MRAIPAHKHVDALIEGANLLHWQLALLDHLQWVSRATTQWAVLTWALDTAIRVHAVCQTIYRKKENPRESQML